MSAARSLREHWPEYLIEGFCLGLFMISACLFTALLEHPGSFVRQTIADDATRRALNGLAMGLTAVALIYSPWGRRSGAHMNPAVTLTFLRLGKVKSWDAVFYIVAQTAGGLGGMLVSHALLGMTLVHPSVAYVVTVPGPAGNGIAFISETLISGGLMGMVLVTTSAPRWARFTGWFAGALLVVYITFEAPLSGMSINPARTVASAIPSGVWTAGWIYLTAPLLGMLAAAELFQWSRGHRRTGCAKLHHDPLYPCIFCGHSGK